MQGHPIRVLLIVDDEHDYIVVRDLLSGLPSMEFILEWVADYGAALDAILSSEFDVCLLDYRLKDRDGLELVQEALSRGAKTPVVFLTGQGGYDLDLEAMSKGAADWLTKGELSAALLERSIRYAMERQRKRAELIKAKRVIQALSECNHAVIHIKDEVDLLRAICRIVVDVCGYRMAWVGYAEEDGDRTVTPVAKYGYEERYLETAKVTWRDAERGKGPTGTCIRTGFPSIIRSAGNQAEFAPWKVEASKRGYASVIGLPLLLDGRKLGALTIYSSETDAFDTEEVEFLVKLSGNLSYGIGVLKLRKAQMQPEEPLKEANLDPEMRVEERTAKLAKVNAELGRKVEERSRAEDVLWPGERLLRRAEVVARFGNWEFLLGCDKVKASEGAKIIYGLEGSEWSMPEVQKIPLPEYRGMLDKALSGLIEEGKPYNVEFKIRRPTDGKIIDIHAIAEYSPENGVVFGVIQDITERKQMEEALQQSNARIGHLNDVLRAIRDVGNIINREKDPTVLLSAVCDSLVQTRGYVTVWIGKPEADSKRVLVVARSGGGSDFLLHAPITWDDSPTGQGPEGTAVRERRAVVLDDIATNPRFALWKDLVMAYGGASVTSVPIIHQERIFGVLTVNADRPHAFDVEEVELLSNLAADLARALQSLENEVARKRAEETMKEGEERLEALAQASFEGIAFTDGDIVIDANSQLVQMLGYDLPEIIGKSLADMIAPEDWESVRQNMEAGYEGLYENRLLRKDRSTLVVEMQAKDFAYRSRIVRVIAVRDITERKRAEAALRESEELYRTLVSLSPDPISVADLDGLLTFTSPKTRQMFGHWPDGKILGRSLLSWVAPEEQQKASANIRGLLTEGRLTDTEYTLIKNDGTRFIGEINAAVIDSPDGSPMRMIVITRDVTERKRAETALRESEEKYRELVQHANSIILHWTREGKITFLNEFGQRFFGYSEAEILGQHVVGTIVPETESTGRDLRPLMDQICADPMAFEYNVNENMRRNGERVWIAWTNKVDLDHQNRAAGILSVGVNITERKRAEEALRESEELYRTIVNLSPDAISLADLNGLLTFTSPKARQIFGQWPDDEILGRSLLSWVAPEEHEKASANIRRLLTEGIFTDVEYTLIKNDGTRFIGEINAAVIHSPDGSPMRMIVITRDVTERKLAEIALRESEERFSRFFRASPIATSISRFSDGQFVDANDAFLRLYGYTREELIGHSALELGLWVNPGLRAKMVKILKEQGRIHDIEEQFRRKSGEIVDVLGFAEAIEIAGQQYVLSLAYDITERKRGEQERKKLEEQLSQAQKMEMVGRLAGGVAHDFNNMLGVIIGRAEMALEQDVSNGKLRHHLDEILKAGLRSADLTRQLLAFARKQIAIPKILDLNGTISSMLQMLRRLIGEDIDLFWAPGLDLWKVRIDPSQVDQILANLAVNARDAISGVGTITIRTDNVVIDDSNRAEIPELIPGQYVLLTVSDTGEGMSKEVCVNIFEPFFTTKEVGKGTGLGLSTVYGIVKQKRLRISVARSLAEPPHNSS